MAIRNANEADLDEVCALVGELAEYERLSHLVSFERERMRGAVQGDGVGRISSGVVIDVVDDA